jgi:hypothetical protein
LAGSESIVERFWLIIRETQQGYMGLVPAHAAAGDVVSILQGGAFPYVLRPSDDHFIFIGEAYVHGIEDIISDVQEGVSEPQQINIR